LDGEVAHFGRREGHGFWTVGGAAAWNGGVNGGLVRGLLPLIEMTVACWVRRMLRRLRGLTAGEALPFPDEDRVLLPIED
jgi:hypothetical protein